MSAAGAIAAAIAAGAVENLLAGSRGWASVCATGFAAVLAAPIGFALAMAVRALWRSWSPLLARLASGPRGRAGGAAALAGALGFAAGAIALAGAAGAAGAHVARSMTHVPVLVGLTVGSFALGAGLVVALVSIPAVRALAAVVAACDRRGALTPERVWAIAGRVAGALALLGWLALLAIAAGSTAIGVAPYLATAGLALAAFHAVAGRPGRDRAAPVLGCVVAGLMLAALTAVAASADPSAVGEARAAPVGGLAIDALGVDAARPIGGG